MRRHLREELHKSWDWYIRLMTRILEGMFPEFKDAIDRAGQRCRNRLGIPA